MNDAKVDLVVSIHTNSTADLTKDYTATFIIGRGGQAEKAAKIIQDEVRKATGWPGPTSPDGVMVSNLHMVRETKAPAVIVEMGFMSNSAQEKQLRDKAFQEVLATAIVKGICRYFDVPFREPGAARVVFKGKEILAEIKDGRTYAEIRSLAEMLGLQLIWDNITKTATLVERR